MYRRLGLIVLTLGLLLSPAHAQNCTALPNTLTNGTLADATQVMGNFTYLGGCAASVANPTFTGNATFPVGVGIGYTGSSSIPLQINGSNAATSGIFHALALSGSQSADDTGTYNGIRIALTYAPPDSGTLKYFYGMNSTPQNSASGAVNNFYGIYSDPGNASTGTVANLAGLYAQPLDSGTGAVTNIYGVYSAPDVTGAASVTTMTALYGNCMNDNSGGTVTTCYQLYLDTPTLTGTITNVRGVYQVYASATNFFAGEVGIGTSTPSQALEVNGKVRIDSLGSATSTPLCITNLVLGAGVVSSCSSSLRYKENVSDASFGLAEVMKMRPVTFKWKGRDENDFGLIAEEVAKINPLFATYRDGKIEGVKYPQLTAVLVGAVKDLKSKSDAQAGEIARLRTQLDDLQKVASARDSAERQLSTLRSKNAELTERFIGLDRRLNALEAGMRLQKVSSAGSGARAVKVGRGG